MEEENAAALICAALIFSELDLDDGFDEFDQVPSTFFEFPTPSPSEFGCGFWMVWARGKSERVGAPCAAPRCWLGGQRQLGAGPRRGVGARLGFGVCEAARVESGRLGEGGGRR